MAAPEKKSILLVVDDELFDRIEEYRFANRIQSRTEAIRQLILAGLGSRKSKAAK